MAIDAARIVPFGPQLPAVKEDDSALIQALRSELDEIRRALDTVASNATDGTVITSPTNHFDLSGLDFATSGHTGFASEVILNAHINDQALHNDPGGYVLTNPTALADQVVTQKSSTALVITAANQTFYENVLEVQNAAFKIGNTPLAAPTWPPGAPGDGEFLLASRRVTSGVGGSTLNIINDLGTITRIDLPVVIRQAATPSTTAGYFLWIDTSGAQDQLKWLGDGGSGLAWQIGFIAAP